MQNEMAHYGCDCWDTEILNHLGWLECVGLADRSAYDLSRHQQFSQKNLEAEEFIHGGFDETIFTIELDKPKVAKLFKKDTHKLFLYF